MSATGERHLGLVSATLVGVGAIVGGGILALAGTAFATAGPGAILAFAINGVIAFLTASSFAELARRFPQSGGTYTYAKRVLPIEVAFVVGWVVWFASIVAGVLYAIGFAVFAAEGASSLATHFGRELPWMSTGGLRIGLALAAIAYYTTGLIRSASGGGNGATFGKIAVFVVLLVGGAIAFIRGSGAVVSDLSPLLPAGLGGVATAMGFTFIALQGFDLIAAVGGEVKDPERNLPRAMYLSLSIALVIYIPLLIIIATVGAPPGETIADAARANPDGFFAVAAGRFLGPAGYWFVIGAGVLSMLSALQANLYGASRVAFAMARDRTLPRAMGAIRGASATPAVAVVVTAAMAAVVAALIGEIAIAGAASSLIFLISFALVHWAAVLARRRSGDRRFPTVPVVGGLACLGLAVFQALTVSAAGTIVALWLVVGVVAYLGLLAPGASLADATAEARDPDLARLRGRSPLVLVPIANPASAAGLVDIAATVRTPSVGRVLLLSTVRDESVPTDDGDEGDRAWSDAQTILAESLRRSFARETPTETMFTIAADPWAEILRVVRLHRCETVVLGAPSGGATGPELENFLAAVDADTVLLRAPRRWEISRVHRVLVPIAGRSRHSRLRARLLASLSRADRCEVTFLRSVPVGAGSEVRRRAEREIRKLARSEAEGHYNVRVVEAVDPVDAIVQHAIDADVVVMGLQQAQPGQSVIGPGVHAIMAASDTPLLLIGSRRLRSFGRSRR